jgi:hypothetical protein
MDPNRVGCPRLIGLVEDKNPQGPIFIHMLSIFITILPDFARFVHHFPTFSPHFIGRTMVSAGCSLETG